MVNEEYINQLLADFSDELNILNIIDVLKTGPCSLGNLSKKTHIDVSYLKGNVREMEQRNYVEEVNGKYQMTDFLKTELSKIEETN
ncbi:MAG: hypothetical protein JW700_02050 [Candidatus Aenigmarchaeota archaeon]|nr:hypothetical protein [Candidatus Aenigmarchaeota archaeon]